MAMLVISASPLAVPSAWLVPISHLFIPCFPRRAALLMSRVSPNTLQLGAGTQGLTGSHHKASFSFKRSPIHIYSSKLWPSKVFLH